jgi:5'-nucleotidase
MQVYSGKTKRSGKCKRRTTLRSIISPVLLRVARGAATVTLSLLAGLFVIHAQTRVSTASVAVQLLAFNDLHGNLEPPAGSNGLVGSVVAGGAEYFAAHLSTLAARNPNTLIVSAGDSIGASPLLSGMFHDEPTIEALNLMGLDVASVGNHEFDNGWRELLRMQNGGCHPVDGCQDGTPFTGAAFPFLAANVLINDSRTIGRTGPLLPPYVIREIGGVRIGFIGLTLKGTPQLVMAAGVEGLKFDSEADTANTWARVLQKQNVHAIVVLIHEGGFPATNNYNSCAGVSGPILDIADRMTDEIDVIVSGHTHRAYNCVIDKKLVTSAAAFGRIITSIDLTLDPRTGEVVSKTARNVVVTRDVPKDAAQSRIIEHYRPFYTTVANKVVGTIAGDISRVQNAAGESSIGNVIADAVFEAARAASQPADLAFMNPGGIRAELPLAGEPAPRRVTYAEASSVLPFRNRIVVQTMTGEMIREVLEQQYDNIAPGEDRILQVSRGFTYTYDRTAPRSHRVDPRSMTIDSRPMAAKQRYRVALNEFIATGGDNFSVLTRGTQAVTIGMDLDAFVAFLERHSPVEPGPMNRITRIK